MATETIKRNIEATLTSLRDLAYEAHSEWEKQGMGDDDLLRLSTAANKVMTELSQTIALGEMSFTGHPTKIRELPGGATKKIQAIKSVRQLTGEGLKEAKECVDRAANGVWSDLNFSAGYGPPSDSVMKQFVAEMQNAGYEVK